MTKITLENIGREISVKRGSIGVRLTAAEIGISPSTLSRIENGHLPDLETFKKLCLWLGVDAGDILETKNAGSGNEGGRETRVHFKRDNTVTGETAKHLAQMILSAQRALDYQRTGN
jgi:transcriptional regulator with XRE-family HTH domain